MLRKSKPSQGGQAEGQKDEAWRQECREFAEHPPTVGRGSGPEGGERTFDLERGDLKRLPETGGCSQDSHQLEEEGKKTDCQRSGGEGFELIK